ncbi:MAG: nucleotidyltransferase family protein [Bryobacteraceae bacterium]|jgi:predicted MFS family arabinose efflux permease
MALSCPEIESADRVDGAAPASRRRRLSKARVPRYTRAALEALGFDGAGSGLLRALDDAEYRSLLRFCDKAHLALTLHHFHGDAMPGWVRDRLERNLHDYSKRFARLKAALFEIADALERRGIEFIVLKGLTHSPEYTPDPLLRAQGDIDIWCKPEFILAARDELLALGYLPLGRSEGRHLPKMVRPTGGDWRGDFYASDLPIAVELHYRLWDERMESIPAPGETEFWDRRAPRMVDGRPLQALSATDTLAFAALHLLWHLLHGDLPTQRAWEIANFLDTHVSDDAFWSSWRQSHADSLRRLEAIVFRLVAEWFGCGLSPVAAGEAAGLPDDVRLWIECYAWSPVEGLFHPNKDELWLQLSLVESFREKLAIFRRRVLPMRTLQLTRAGTPAAKHIERELRFAGRRLVHHARAFIPTLFEGARWRLKRTRLGGGFARYLATSAFFNLGMLVFLVLYNLYLLGLGYHADVLGRIAGSMRAGTLLGTIPAAGVARRAGLRAALLIAALGTAATALLRTWNAGQAWLTAAAFCNGVCLALWAVSFSPSIAGLTDERNRRFGFSVSCAVGIAIGIPGGMAAGYLPGAMSRLLHLSGSLAPLRWALVAASGVVALGALPAASLRFQRISRTETKTYPRARVVAGFLIALACWSAATAAFNPFFNAFFTERLRMSVQRIGAIFSYSHMAQALALLSASVILKKLGDVKGIAWCQLATGAALALLAFSASGAGAAAVYIGYMSLQYMSEPGLFHLLMSRVAPGERGGASALYFLVTSLTGSLAAFAGGAAILRFGYPPVLVASGCVAMASAFLFRTLVREKA